LCRRTIADAKAFGGLYDHFKPDYVVHLGAQAGVRYSLENPAAYVHSNLLGFTTVLEACRRRVPKHLVFASSSSVYGAGARTPFAEDANTDQPLSFYGATKKGNEVDGPQLRAPARAPAHRPAFFHRLRTLGPARHGADALRAGHLPRTGPITLFNDGKNLRDFTYVDDIVDGVLKVLLYPPPERAGAALPDLQPRAQPPGRDASSSCACWSNCSADRADRARPARNPATCARPAPTSPASGLPSATTPRVPLEEGLRRFVAWFQEYYRPS
jgi:UDP-glucuronate 4-epimerase